VPLLIVPPVVNKFYILDISPGRSMIEYLVDRDLQVFTISWRNLTAAQKKWGGYFWPRRAQCARSGREDQRDHPNAPIGRVFRRNARGDIRRPPRCRRRP
jgi:hypothetical protein